MKRPRFLIWALIVILVSSCQQEPTPSAGSKPSLTASPGAVGRQEPRVLVIALDSARPDWAGGYIEDGVIPNLATLSERGVAAEYMQTVDPAWPRTTYLSLSTGAFPNRTGKVCGPRDVDEYGSPLQAAYQGSAQTYPLPEPIWRTAMRSGLRTAALFWPGASLDVTDLRADYTVVAAESNIPSAQHVISFQDATGWEALPASFSPLQEGTLRVAGPQGGTVAVFNVLAADRVNDEETSYDTLFLDTDKDLANGHTELHPGKWAASAISPRLHSGAYFCLTAFSDATATVYQSRVCYNRACPSELVRTVNSQLGFPPPVPDLKALQTNWTSARQYYEMAELRSQWMTRVVQLVYQAYRPDLMLTAQNIIAECAQPFLLVDDRQEGYTPELAEEYASYLQQAHSSADANLGRILSLVDPEDCSVFVLSGQGAMPVHTSVRLNTILGDAWLQRWEARNGQLQIDSANSKAFALASGGGAHIYINLQGRERTGIVEPDAYADLVQQIIEILEGTLDDGGQPVFARTLKRGDLDIIHMDAPNCGDLFVQAAPGYCLSDGIGFADVLAPSQLFCATGFDSTLPEMRAIFVAAGRNLAQGKTIPAVHITDVAPTIAYMMGIQPSDDAAGRILDEIWR